MELSEPTGMSCQCTCRNGDTDRRCSLRTSSSSYSRTSTIKAVIYLLTHLSLLPIGVSSLQCYLCSWSPRDWNATHHCLPGSFSPNTAVRVHCDTGCEMVYVYNTNSEIELFYRNCARRGLLLTNTWRSVMYKTGKRKVHGCDWSLCNGSISQKRLQWSGLGFLLLFTQGVVWCIQRRRIISYAIF